MVQDSNNTKTAGKDTRHGKIHMLEEYPDFMRGNIKLHQTAALQNLRDKQQTNKILVTDMDQYLSNAQPHENCISCDKCLSQSLKGKFVKFKYPGHIQSTYNELMRVPDKNKPGQHHPGAEAESPVKKKPFEIGSLRQSLKV